MSSFPTPPLATRRHRLRAGYLAGCLAWMASTAAVAAPMSRAVLPPQAGAYNSAPVISYRDFPFRTVVRQQYDFSCGSAAVATLLRYSYGRDVDESSIFRAMYVIGNKGAIQK